MTQARGEGRTGAEPAGPPDDVADAPNVRRLPVAPVELPPGRRTAERAPTGAAELAAIAEEVGLRRVRFVAWRDLDDPEAGGSEVHAHRVATLWAEAGIDVAFRTSAVAGGEPRRRARRLPGHPQGRPLRGLPGRRGGGAGRRAAAR